MKKVQPMPVWVVPWTFLAIFLLAIAGCASKPRPDWDQRIGNYTLDQAVKELGPAFASTELQDGTMVAEWFLKHGAQFSFGMGTGVHGGSGGVGLGHSVTAPAPGHYLRLVFGPDGQLQRWERIRH